LAASSCALNQEHFIRAALEEDLSALETAVGPMLK
jgi:hypothetical protein